MTKSKHKARGGHVKQDKHAAKAAGGNEATAQQPEQTAKPKIIKVLKTDAKYRGAREAWYNRLKEYDGKPLDDFLESCKSKCPQLTKNNTAEPPMGWVGFFKREGIMTEINPS